MKIIFAGTPEFAATSLAALFKSKHSICAVYTQPDRPAGRGRKLTASPVKEFALKHQLPVFQSASLKNAEEQEKLRVFNADVMVVAAYGLILPKAVLEIPRLGCINIHASWLPRWRGAAPIQRAILAGDTETGISIMQMDEGLDTGEVLCVHTSQITDHETSATLHDKLATLGAEAIVEALDELEKDKAIRTPQNSELATYAHKLTKAEAQIDWKKSALEIDRMIRAFNPWPVAFTSINDVVLRIWKAESLAAHANVEPGTICGVGKHYIDVACGDGVVRLLEIQWPNATRLSVEQALLAQNASLQVGKRFQ